MNIGCHPGDLRGKPLVSGCGARVEDRMTSRAEECENGGEPTGPLTPQTGELLCLHVGYARKLTVTVNTSSAWDFCCSFS